MPTSTQSRRALVGVALLVQLVAPVRGQDAEWQLGVPRAQWGAFFSGQDQRVPIEPTTWPWHAIGRVNIVDRLQRRHCTGTLVGPRLVLTAGHCLYDHRVGRWVPPGRVHFVAGQARDAASGHSRAVEIILPPGRNISVGLDPRAAGIRADLIAHDWALIVLESALPVKPIPVKAIAAHAFAGEIAEGELARAGYSADRQYLLSVHRGCAAALSHGWPGAMLNRCDQRPGDSGSPILLLRAKEEAFVIGLSTAAAHAKRGDDEYVALSAMGPSAGSFVEALERALKH